MSKHTHRDVKVVMMEIHFNKKKILRKDQPKIDEKVIDEKRIGLKRNMKKKFLVLKLKHQLVEHQNHLKKVMRLQ